LASVAVLVTVVVPPGNCCRSLALLDIVTRTVVGGLTTKVTLLAHVPCAALTTDCSNR